MKLLSLNPQGFFKVFPPFALVFAALIVMAIIGSYLGAGGSHLPAKPDYAQFQLTHLRSVADACKDELLKAPELNNAVFISMAKPGGQLWKYNDKGEVLDPWGQPYVISRNGDQITITSPGLEKYKRLSWFQKWWSSE